MAVGERKGLGGEECKGERKKEQPGKMEEMRERLQLRGGRLEQTQQIKGGRLRENATEIQAREANKEEAQKKVLS